MIDFVDFIQKNKLKLTDWSIYNIIIRCKFIIDQKKEKYWYR